MKLTDVEIEDYILLYRKHFGGRVTKKKAEADATRFARLVETVLRARSRQHALIRQDDE